jgi:hypothetical protein
MTCYIGTVSGGKDIGRIRVKSATATTMEVAENSINWSGAGQQGAQGNGWFLTVVQYYEPWGVFPRITLDGDNVPSFFKDYDVAYTNQNQILDPIVCMGPHYAGFLDQGDAAPTGTCEVFYTASGSYNPTPAVGGFGARGVAGISSYQWVFEGGNPTGSTDADPGYITYTGSGNFLTTLEITTDQNKTFSGRRHIMILDRPENAGGNKPLSKWGIRSMDGDRGSGGYNARLWIREEVNQDDIVDGALIVVFSEDWEGYVSGKVGANAEGRDATFLVGYVLEDSISYNPVTSEVQFEVGSISLRMQELSTFSATLESKVNAMTWNEMVLMTVDRGIEHFLRWHSTVLTCTDFSPTDDAKPVQYLDLERGKIYDGINNLLQSALIARIVSDRQGKLWCEVDARVITTGSARQANDHMQGIINLTRQDWRSEISLDREFDSRLSYLEMGGIAYSGPGGGSGTVGAYLSGAPGVAPDYFGTIERLSGLVIDGQTQLNELTGHAWAIKNAEYPDATIPLAGDYRFIDIAPQQRVNLTVVEGDTWRRISFTNKPFIPDGISYVWDAARQALIADLVLVEETWGLPGDTIDIPVDPPYDYPDLPDYPFPTPPVPPPPEPPVPVGAGSLVYMVMGNNLVRTRDFQSVFPTWEDISPGSQITGSISAFYLDPADPKGSAILLTNVTVGADPNNGPRLYRTTNLDAAAPTWTSILAHNTMTGLIGGNNQRLGEDVGLFMQIPGTILLLCRNQAIGGQARILRTTTYGGAGGVAWEAGAVSPMPANSDRQQLLAPSPHADSPYGATVYATWNEDWYLSENGGTIWSVLDDQGSAHGNMDLVLPYYGNPGDEICLVSRWSGADKNLYYTNDKGATEVNMSLWHNGVRWAVKRSGGESQMGRCLWSHPINGWFYCLLHEAVAEDNDRNTVFAAHSYQYASGWFVRYEWPNQNNADLGDSSGGIYPLAIHNANSLLFYAGGGAGASGNGWVLGSADAGRSWAIKNGNIESIVGSPQRPLTIQVVWTE